MRTGLIRYDPVVLPYYRLMDVFPLKSIDNNINIFVYWRYWRIDITNFNLLN